MVNGSAILSGGLGIDSLSVDSYTTASLSGGDENDNLNASDSRNVTLHGDAGNDNLNANNIRNSSLYGDTGDDSLSANINWWYGTYSSLDGYGNANKFLYLDGGDGNDTLNATTYTYNWHGQVSLALLGGSGNDRLTVSDGLSGDTGASGQSSGIGQATLDGGAGDDVLSASGVVQLGMTGGAGADRFVLTAQQYRTLEEGSRTFSDGTGAQTVVAATATVITDFVAGAGQDVLDVADLLRNGTSGFDGSNPFTSGYLKLQQSGADTQVVFDADGAAGLGKSGLVIAVLQNVNAADLVAANFTPAFSTDGLYHVNTSPTGEVLISG